ncbi:hypothetical protein HK097_005612 [Rhizophlyctis rosea]|uniref:Uncharacterized protein n=1 Tax=Rhizophlyctis rosea TaxID=64517 RepID=A0AAD5SEX7_9FUNG|nr:hypothetical protein HK097_005612 [Rhizophlyctis rosea]
MPFAGLVDKELYNVFSISNDGQTTAKVRFAGYFGNVNGIATAVNPVHDEVTATIDEPFEWMTKDQTYALPDSGNVIQFLCEEGDSLRFYEDLAEVRMQAFRDTNVSKPVAMTTSAATLENGKWRVKRIWNDNPLYYDAYYYPKPMLACAAHNADFIEIGDFTTAKYILVAWVPQWRIEQTHALGAYARYVKDQRDNNGKDTIAVHMRVRVSTQIGELGHPWVSDAKPNCTAEVVADPVRRWQCPDHMWFKNTQMGELHLGKGRLQSLTPHNQKWFKEYGVDFTADVIPIVQSLISYSGDVYAAPVSVSAYPWMVNITTLNTLRKTDSSLKLPPPLENWGLAWWKAWNMKELKKYLQKMVAANFNSLIPLPSIAGGETEMFTYLGYYYGATLFNSSGRCGLLDGKAAAALEDTIVFWNQSTTRIAWDKTTGILQPRVAYPVHREIFEEWRSQPKKENPLEEPIFMMGDTHTWDFGNPQLLEQPGFSFENGFGSDLVKIYPPTGVAQVSAMMVGLHRENPHRDSSKAYHALLHAIAFNDRLHVNDPFVKDSGPQGGVSGYRSAKYTMEYIGQGATRDFYTDMMDQVMFMGYPVPQYASYGLLEKYNPMQIVFNEIMFKNVPVTEALERACTIINYATRPPCDSSHWRAKLQPDHEDNKADVIFEWREDKNLTCRDDLFGAKALPDIVINAVPLATIATQSKMAQAIIGISTIGIIFEVTLGAFFVWKRHAQVIRAAALTPSLFILFGTGNANR